MATPRSLASWCLLLLLAAGAAAAGCAKGEAPTSGAPPGVAAQHQVAQAGEGLPASERAMRITVETSVVVARLDDAAQAVRDAVGKAGGYVGEARTSGSDEARYASFEVHVPVGRLPAFRAEIARLGEIASDVEKAEDVTEQRADIDARLRNARAEDKRLLELLDKRTGSLADVVAVEKELASVRETIERMEAQSRVLEGQISLATVKLQLSVRYAAGAVGPGRRILHAAGDGVSTAGSFLLGLVVVAASAGPTVIIVLALIYAIFRAVRFARRRAAARARP
jgi:hypothetical protein